LFSLTFREEQVEDIENGVLRKIFGLREVNSRLEKCA
jgi:hypothetical protein